MHGRVRLAAIIVASCGLDQATKALARAFLTDGDVNLLGSFLGFRLRHNPGLAWGLGADVSEAGHGLLFPLVAVLVGAVLVWVYHRLPQKDWPLRDGVALILGGGAGNFIDRLGLGYVVDFIAVRAGFGSFVMSGTFNVADVAMIVGVGLIGWRMMRKDKTPAMTPEEDSG